MSIYNRTNVVRGKIVNRGTRTGKRAAKTIIYGWIGKWPWSYGQTVLKIGMEAIFYFLFLLLKGF